MADGLREALEAAIERAQPSGGMRHGHESVRVAELRTIVRNHPAPDQVEITDEAANILASKIASSQAGLWEHYSAETQRLLLENMLPFAREALAAALPYLVPRPLLDQAAVEAVIDEHFDLSAGPGAVMDSHLAIVGIMQLAQPMPTQEQIASAIREVIWHTRHFWVDENDCEVPDGSPEAVNREVITYVDPKAAAAAVLSLLGGES